MSKTPKTLIFVIVLFVLTGIIGCGGGGGSSNVNDSNAPASGIAVDPYIADAVFEEIPAGGGPALQFSTPSDSSGYFTFKQALTPGSIIKMRAGLQGQHNHVPFKGILKRVVDSEGPLVVSPLTTLMANGLSSQEVVSLLDTHNLSGLTEEDVTIDPMAGLESKGQVEPADLVRLQASVAVNSFLTLMDDFDMGYEDVVAHSDHLAAMVAVAKQTLSADALNAAISDNQTDADLLASALAFGADRPSLSHAISASVEITETVVVKLQNDSSIDPVEEAGYLMDNHKDLAIHYFAMENADQPGNEVSVPGTTGSDNETPQTGNTLPVADAGSNQSVLSGAVVRLDGSNSTDPDGDSLTYEWTVLDAPFDVVLSDPTASNPTFLANAEGNYEIQLVVNDGLADSDAKTVTVVAESIGSKENFRPSTEGPNFSLRGDPGFNADQLSSHVRLWYDRLWAAIENPNQYPDSTSLAQSNDTYQYGRALNAYITALLEVLRVTGDLRLLDEVDRVAQLMRSELQDRSILSKNGSSYQSDGYLNWQYFYDAGYHGTDVHEMDEILSHSLVAAFAYAFHVNRDLDSRYAERADFWTDYLKNHFEAKWRKRKNKSTGPFLDKTLTHAYSHWIRYHYYMHLLTGEQWYQTEAIRKAEVVKDQMIEVNNGKAFVWNHFTHLESGSTRRECQYFYYGRKTVSAAVDLALEGFSVFTDAFVEKMAGTVTEFIIDNGATDFAPDICGDKNMAGLVASGRNRETQSRWSISNYGLAGAWDATGVINNVAEQVHMDIESNPDNPKRIFIPAGIVFSLLKR